MATNQYRHQAEGGVQPKEKGADPFENAPQGNQTDADSTVERGLYLPLAWAQLGNAVKPAKFRGKNKRKTRADAIRAKRSMGHVDLQLAGLLVLAAVSALLLIGGAR